jgi:hypothetical protein
MSFYPWLILVYDIYSFFLIYLFIYFYMQLLWFSCGFTMMCLGVWFFTFLLCRIIGPLEFIGLMSFIGFEYFQHCFIVCD